MKKTDKPKLNVNIETVRPLTNEQLDEAEGGRPMGCDTALNCKDATGNCIAGASDACYTVVIKP
jgi:hypothetical protein